MDFCFMCKFKKLFFLTQIFGWKNANKNMSSMIAITYKLCQSSNSRCFVFFLRKINSLRRLLLPLLQYRAHLGRYRMWYDNSPL